MRDMTIWGPRIEAAIPLRRLGWDWPTIAEKVGCAYAYKTLSVLVTKVIGPTLPERSIRAARALELRDLGWSYVAIAEELEYDDEDLAKSAVAKRRKTLRNKAKREATKEKIAA